jgi:hypothetical protein
VLVGTATVSPFLIVIKSLHIFKIGRKHKSHRQQLEQSKPWRNSEKGRKGDKNKGKGKGRRNRMGQEESRMVDDKTPPETLESRSVEAIAKYIKDGKVKRIVVMVSAIVTGIQDHLLIFGHRLELESVHQRESPISDLQTLVYMPT